MESVGESDSSGTLAAAERRAGRLTEERPVLASKATQVPEPEV